MKIRNLYNLIPSLVIPLIAGVFIDAKINTNKYIEPQIEQQGEIINELHEISYKRVDREDNLKRFFEKYNSPLVENTDTFVKIADEYNLDYRLLPAISCMESSCGKKLIPNSYNPFGWGIYGNNYIAFDDYDHAIATVGEGLYTGYVLKGADTIEKIAPIYTPPNHVHWLHSVKYFMNQIDANS